MVIVPSSELPHGQDLEVAPSTDLQEEFRIGLAEFLLTQPKIKKYFYEKGFKQLGSPSDGFDNPTIPPGLDGRRYIAWIREEKQNHINYLAELPEEQKESYKRRKAEYDKVVSLLGAEINTSVGIIQGSRYGLREIIIKLLNGDKLPVSEVIEIIETNGVLVTRYPDKTDGFNIPGNHGISRYKSGAWHMGLDGIALNSKAEVLHELIAIEVFKRFIDTKVDIGGLISSSGLILASMLANRTSIQESIVRGLSINTNPLMIPIIESYFEIFGKWGEGSPIIENFKRLLEDNGKNNTLHL